MTLSDEQHREIADIAELQVQRAMRELFEQSLPRIIAAAFSAHNADARAHTDQIAQRIEGCPVHRQFRRWKWLLIGLTVGAVIASSGGNGGLLLRLLPFLAG